MDQRSALAFRYSDRTAERARRAPGSTFWATDANGNGGTNWKAKIPGDASIGELPEMRALLLAAKRSGTVLYSSGQPIFLVIEFGWEPEAA